MDGWIDQKFLEKKNRDFGTNLAICYRYTIRPPGISVIEELGHHLVGITIKLLWRFKFVFEFQNLATDQWQL